MLVPQALVHLVHAPVLRQCIHQAPHRFCIQLAAAAVTRAVALAVTGGMLVDGTKVLELFTDCQRRCGKMCMPPLHLCECASEHCCTGNLTTCNHIAWQKNLA